MKRFIFPIFIFGWLMGLFWAAIFLFVPPVNGLVVAAFLLLGGLSLASFGSLAIYYLRLTWGPKDSPRFILRRSLRQAFFLSLAAIGFLLLQLFGATNVVTVVLVLGLVVLMERLT